MKEEMLQKLVEETFRNIACPLEGNGVYAELENAIKEAYNLGKKGQGELISIPVPVSSERMRERA